MSECAWKPNWEETKKHFIDWWAGTGLVVGAWNGVGGQPAIEPTTDPGPAERIGGVAERMTDVYWRPLSAHYGLARQRFPLDCLPISRMDLGPGSLALMLGSEPGFTEGTVWYHPCIENERAPESLPPLEFDADNPWWQVTEALCRRAAELGEGKYLVGCPDLIENIDILASLRGAQTMLMDMIERPGWVSEKMFEINRAWFEAYDRIYEIIKKPDGGSAWSPFTIWGPGRTAKVQCDASAMFSPDMFKRFVVPALAEQCAWLDFSMFHLDGHECIPHLDHLLAIDALSAVEWTPDPNVPAGGDPEWYPMYKRIKEAGKSVQAIGVRLDEIAPLLDAVGPEGMYVMTDLRDMETAERVARVVEPYR